MNIFRTLWKSIKDLFEDLFVLAIANILWVLFNVLLIAAVALALFAPDIGDPIVFILLLASILPFGPANAGLYNIAERVTDGRTSSWRDFFAGVRTYARLSWKVYGLWMLGLLVILASLHTYSQPTQISAMLGPTVSSFLGILFFYFELVWFGLLIYIGPLMLIQSDKSIKTIARNAALMTFGRPLFTLITLILMAIILLVSIWLTILAFIATFSFLAVWSFRATLTLIAEAEARREALEAKNAAQQNVATGKGRGGQVRPRE
jgi:uncharacterized membrane protein YesL